MPNERVRQLWETACKDHPLFARSNTLALFQVEPVLAKWLTDLKGNDLRALKAAVHAVLDRRLGFWNNRFTYTMKPARSPKFSCTVDGLPLRVRLHDTKGMVIDVIGKGAALCDDDLIIDQKLPAVMMVSMIGRCLGDVMETVPGMVDGSRTVVSTHVRFGTKTVLRMTDGKTVGLTYAKLFGSPGKRFPKKQWPTATA